MRKVAVFDFDGTVIRGDSVVALLLYAWKRKAIPLSGLIRVALYGLAYRVKLTDALTAKTRSHAFLADMPAKEREDFLRAFAHALTERAYPQAVEQMRRHRAAGDMVMICSASCACYMRYVSELLGADALLCTPSEPDGRVRGPNCRGEEKVRRVTAWLQERGLSQDAVCAAYGDSRGDAPILKLSAHPVLINAKRGLKKLMPDAERREWKR